MGDVFSAGREMTHPYSSGKLFGELSYEQLRQLTTELTEEDMTVDSPYNLYTHAGLPPTPISNPGFASIRAALQPAETSYYYYVLGNDGLHIFSETYAEHQQVINSLG